MTTHKSVLRPRPTSRLINTSIRATVSQGTVWPLALYGSRDCAKLSRASHPRLTLDDTAFVTLCAGQRRVSTPSRDANNRAGCWSGNWLEPISDPSYTSRREITTLPTSATATE